VLIAFNGDVYQPVIVDHRMQQSGKRRVDENGSAASNIVRTEGDTP
jgi:hypothetical protein